MPDTSTTWPPSLNYETIVTNLMTRQIGCDREDLCLNGDERDVYKRQMLLSAV